LSSTGQVNCHQTLFALNETITLYDLTNTFFEGVAKGNTKAKRGHSKEKRSDCPLVTLALVLDGSCFPIRSEVFAGNVREPKTWSRWCSICAQSLRQRRRGEHRLAQGPELPLSRR